MMHMGKEPGQPWLCVKDPAELEGQYFLDLQHL